jgi:xanthine/uracil/vitamin C permease (AzgA family)
VIIIAASLHYHVKGAFCIAMIFGSVVWWSNDNSWPTSVVRFPEIDPATGIFSENLSEAIILSLQLVFIYILSLSGLVSSMAGLGGLVRTDNTTPRNRWIYVVCGVVTFISGLLSGPPILISPESAAGIKAGAKTGLSTIVCGLLFGLSVFLGPFLEKVPNAATAPLLFAVGIVLFQNVQKLNWKLITDSTPAYVVLFFIPFTYSILQGVVIGYVVYLILGLLTGQIFYSGLDIWLFYFDFSPTDLFRRTSNSDPTTQTDIESDLIDPPPAPPFLPPTRSHARSRAPSVAQFGMDELEEPAVCLTLGIDNIEVETPSYFPTAQTFKQYQETHSAQTKQDENI